MCGCGVSDPLALLTGNHTSICVFSLIAHCLRVGSCHKQTTTVAMPRIYIKFIFCQTDTSKVAY